jgi:hypothetical protein
MFPSLTLFRLQVKNVQEVFPPKFIDTNVYIYLFLYLFCNVCINFLNSNTLRALIETYRAALEVKAYWCKSSSG